MVGGERRGAEPNKAFIKESGLGRHDHQQHGEQIHTNVLHVIALLKHGI
jgi:hypothetical protein